MDSDFNVCVTDYVSYSLERCYLTCSLPALSPHYAAPECFQCQEIDFDLRQASCVCSLQKVDIFALGLIAYEILTGQQAFSSELTVAEIRRKTKSRDRPPLPCSINMEFRQLIERCWDADPSKRPSIGEVWRILQSLRYRIIPGVDSPTVESRVAPCFPP
jgi:serine/threonine protein kinase